jgi:hypothetical protein
MSPALPPNICMKANSNWHAVVSTLDQKQAHGCCAMFHASCSTVCMSCMLAYLSSCDCYVGTVCLHCQLRCLAQKTTQHEPNTTQHIATQHTCLPSLLEKLSAGHLATLTQALLDAEHEVVIGMFLVEMTNDCSTPKLHVHGCKAHTSTTVAAVASDTGRNTC